MYPPKTLIRRFIERLIELMKRKLGVIDTCRVYLESIAFNHNPNTISGDALNIRKNKAIEVGVPEWRPGKLLAEESPAAYSIEDTMGNTITIKIRLRPRLLFFPKEVEIMADGGGILGPVDQTVVSTSGAIDVMLNHHAIGQGSSRGVRKEDIEWTWKYRCGNGLWRPLAVTKHRIYIVRREPHAPWIQQPFPNDHNPWTDALEFACSVSAPSWEPDPMDSLAYGVASFLNAGGTNANPAHLIYDHDNPNGAQPHYVEGNVFNLTGIIERLNGGIGAGEKVDCRDCASMMSTFANILGCDLRPVGINVGGMNPVIPIGLGQWWIGAMGGGRFVDSWGDVCIGFLTYHEIAGKGDPVSSMLIYDICYLVNDVPDPNHPERAHPTQRALHYAYGERFSELGVLDYIERLHPHVVSYTFPIGGDVRSLI